MFLGKRTELDIISKLFGPSLERIVGNTREVDRLELDESLESVQSCSPHLTKENTEDSNEKVIYTGKIAYE